MKTLTLCFCVAFGVSSFAQQPITPSQTSTATARSPSTTASLAAGTIIDIELAKSLDAKKSKSGDPVEARVRSDVRQSGEVVIKRGAKVMGHVTHTQPKSKGQSEVGITFDTVVAKNGEMVPLVAAIQAMAAAREQRGVTDSGMVSSAIGTDPGGPSGTNPLQKTGADADINISAMNTAANTGSITGGSAALNPSSKGVFGMPGVGLKNELVNNSVRSIVISVEDNVHLNNGTQMILRVLGP